jgi:hypothetical protein
MLRQAATPATKKSWRRCMRKDEAPQSAEGQGYVNALKQVMQLRHGYPLDRLSHEDWKTVKSLLIDSLEQAYAQGRAEEKAEWERLNQDVHAAIQRVNAIRAQPEGEARMSITAEEFDRRAEAGEDMSGFFVTKGKR